MAWNLKAARWIVLLSALSCGGNDTSGADDTCAFAEDASSCWRTLVSDVRSCLGNAVGVQGALSFDGLTCTSSQGPKVVFASPVSVSAKPRQLDATIYGATLVQCAHVVDDSITGALTVTGPSGTVTLSVDGNGRDATVTCPSGQRHVVTGQAVMEQCFSQALAGGIPAMKVAHDGVSASLAFSGSDWKLYDCR